MIQAKSLLKPLDNMGADTVQCIKILNGTKKKIARYLGEYIIVSIRKKRKINEQKNQQKKNLNKKIYPAIIVHLRKNYKRKNGLYIKFDSNKVILMSDFNKFTGNIIKNPIVYELKQLKTIVKFKKILTHALLV